MKTMRDKNFEIKDGSSISGSHWKNLTGQKQIVLIDFDHTITTRCLACSDGIESDAVQRGAKKAITELSKTFEIWIFTGNYEYLSKSTPVNRTVASIELFLKKNGIPFDKILQTKPPACFIIDDRAIHHANWALTMEQVNGRLGKGQK